MFHDIQDTSCLAAQDYSGGVPLFWQHLQRALGQPGERSRRSLELTGRGGDFLPMFGIGIIWGGHHGTAALEGGADVRAWSPWKGKGAKALWPELCADPSQPHHAVCRISKPDDLHLVVSATKRSFKASAIEYASVRWYNRSAA